MDTNNRFLWYGKQLWTQFLLRKYNNSIILLWISQTSPKLLACFFYVSEEMLWGQQEWERRCISSFLKSLFGAFCTFILTGQDRTGRERGGTHTHTPNAGRGWNWTPNRCQGLPRRRCTYKSLYKVSILLPVSSQSLGSDPAIPPSVVNPVSGFKRGASWTSTESLLLHVGVEARQNQNAAFRFGFGAGGVTRGSLLLQWHDALHQARDGSVNVGVVLERERTEMKREIRMTEEKPCKPPRPVCTGLYCLNHVHPSRSSFRNKKMLKLIRLQPDTSACFVDTQ